MKQCNRCFQGDCKLIDRHRSGARKLTAEFLRRECNRWVPPPQWTVPLLMVALESNPQGVLDVLEALNLRVQELADSPYFKIILEDE